MLFLVALGEFTRDDVRMDPVSPFLLCGQLEDRAARLDRQLE